MRVVFDTNVVVSAFLSPTGVPAQVFAQWEHQVFELVVSQALLQEYQRVLLYERIAARHQMSAEEVEEIIEGFRQFALTVEPLEALAVITEDPADNRVLECAVAGAADYIVNGDAQHFLPLQEYQGTQILSPAAFLALLRQE